MTLRPTTLAHWLFLGGLALLVAAAVFLWSTRGLGNGDPHEVHRSAKQIAATAALERNTAIMRFSLLCLDQLMKGKAKEAVVDCGLALDLDPDSVSLLNLRGNAHMALGHAAAAIADFSRAIALAPQSPEGYRFRANLYATQHRDALALADYDHAVTLSPSEPTDIELRGNFNRQRGRYAAAIADFSAAIAMRPDLARAWNSRCWTRFLANSRLAQALADCDKSLQLDPANAYSHDSRGFVLLRLTRYRAAIASFSTALRFKPKLASSWFGRGVAKLRIADLSGQRDIATAKGIEPGIEARFGAYGIKIPSRGPAGT